MSATRAEIAAANTLPKLKALAAKHGYSLGWALKINEVRNDRVHRSGTPRKEVVRQEQNTISQDERAGERRVARSAYLYPHYSVLD